MAAPLMETARLRLRAAEHRDFDAYAAMWAEPRTTRYIGGEPRSRSASWLRFFGLPGHWALMGFGYWVFADRRDDRFIGCGGLAWLDRGITELEGVPEAGWAIAPDAWGQGLASEAMAAVLDWADQALGAPQVRCIINPGHAASERVAARLGFRGIGVSDALGEPVNLYARMRRG